MPRLIAPAQPRFAWRTQRTQHLAQFLRGRITDEHRAERALEHEKAAGACGGRAAHLYRLGQVFEFAGAAHGDHRDADRFRHAPDQFQIIALPRAVTVNRV